MEDGEALARSGSQEKLGLLTSGHRKVLGTRGPELEMGM